MKKTILIILNGGPTSGKDTFVELCKKTPFTIIHRSSVEPIKEIAYKLGWDGEKNPKIRKFLSDLKDLCTETFDTSFKYIEGQLDTASYANVDFLFVDCREPNEIDRFVKEIGAITVYIDGSKRINEKISNHADANVLDYHYDYYIDNNGNLSDLEDAAQLFMSWIAKELE